MVAMVSPDGFFIIVCCDWVRLCRRVGIYRKQKKALAQALSFLRAQLLDKMRQ
jgi:hypothetical protein